MSSQPLVSVIIPSYNSEELIAETLQSVLNQTYTNWECTIIDDGSIDDTKNVVGDFIISDPRFKLYGRDRAPKGAHTCRNIGIEKCKGDYVIFLDSDDQLMTHCLEARVNKFKSYPALDFLVFPTKVIRIDQNREFIKIPKSQDYLSQFIRHENPWTIMGPIWKKETLLKLEGFDERFPRFQDPELHTRALLSHFKFKYFDTADDADNIYVANQLPEDCKKTDNILIGCSLYIDTVYEHSNSPSKEIEQHLILLYTDFLKKHVLYQDCPTNKEFIRFRKKIRGVSFKEKLKIQIQIWLKTSRLIKVPPFKQLSYKLWNI